MKTDGGPAFPQPIFLAGNDNTINVPSTQNGMSLRDYFAAKALQRILSADSDSPYPGCKTVGDVQRYLSAIAYGYADAMLAEREK